MDNWRLWTILLVVVGTLCYNIVSNYAIRGNDLKHIKDALVALEKRIMKRIERLEQRFFNKGE